jgi:hypothetical protein
MILAILIHPMLIHPDHLAIRMELSHTGHVCIALLPNAWLTKASFMDCYRMSKIILREECSHADAEQLCKFIRQAQRDLKLSPQ